MRRFGLTLAVLVGAVLTASLLAQVPTNVLNPASDLAGKTLVTAEGARTISGVFTWTVPMRTLAGTTGSPGVTGSTDTTTGLTLGTALVGVSISGVQQLLVSPSGVSSATGFTGTILTAAQPNITSTGALTVPSLTATGSATVGTTLAVNGFGSHIFTAAGSGPNRIEIINQSAGTSNSSAVVLLNNNNFSGAFNTYAGNFSGTGTYDLANGVSLYADANMTNGLSLAALGASAKVVIFANGSTQRMQIGTGVTVGDTTDPGATNFRVAGTSTLVGTTNHVGDLLQGGNVMDSVAVPTKSSGCGGAGFSVTGNDYAFTWTTGAAPGASCVLNLNRTYAHAPICLAQNATVGLDIPAFTNSTTQIIMNTTGFGAGEILSVLCRGY